MIFNQRKRQIRHLVSNFPRSVPQLRSAGVSVRHVGTGSTPCCSHQGDSWSELTEMHPGNYVFYDNQQRMVRSQGKSRLEK